jgi:hypothetical protein
MKRSYFFPHFAMANTSLKAPRPAHQDATPSAPAAAKPAAVFRYGSVSAAVFSDVVQKDGRTFTVSSVSLRRAYRDAAGAWQHTHSLRPQDLLPAALALTRAYEHVQDAQGEDAASE